MDSFHPGVERLVAHLEEDDPETVDVHLEKESLAFDLRPYLQL